MRVPRSGKQLIFEKSKTTIIMRLKDQFFKKGICCATLALCIYVIGGRNNLPGSNLQGNTDCADVECYDPFTNKWLSFLKLIFIERLNSKSRSIFLFK